MSPQITFHIGLEKTGTDSFQIFCEANRRKLLRHGILYPVRNLAFSAPNHRPLVACYLPYRDLSVARARERSKVLRSLRAEIDRAKSDSVLISAEHFSSRFRDAEIEQLASDFAGYPCRIVVVVRGHESRIHSGYFSSILSGRTLTFETYCNEIFHPENNFLRYRETIAPWSRIFGERNLSLHCLARGENVVEILCATLFPDAAISLTDMSYRKNQSLGANAVEALRQLNLALPAAEEIRDELMGRAKWQLVKRTRRAVVALLAEATNHLSQGRFQLSEQFRERLQEIVRVDRQWLEEAYGIRLDEPDVNTEQAPDEMVAKRLAAQVMDRWWVRRAAAMR